MKASSNEYFPHIDGLRAISIILVILFHYEIGPFTGGYIGVDIFFTISGYLIIGSIVYQIENGKFRLVEFWQRRIRRLIPAITATLILTLLVGVILMNPSDLMSLSRQSVFALFSSINFTLLKDVDYFDLDVSQEPLVHFWSLAVEEQFYLTFPILALLVFSKFKNSDFRKIILNTLIILSIISLVISELAVSAGEQLLAYYMMPTRFSQLAFGGILAILVQPLESKQIFKEYKIWLYDILVILGVLILIDISVRFDVNTPFPGVYAVLPTLGAMLILFGGGKSRIKVFFENKLIRYIGKVSFSLYLVHWPVWSFMGYYFNRPLEPNEVGVALILTLSIAIIIYHFIECPIRFSARYKDVKMYSFIKPVMVVAILLPVSILLLDGLPMRIDDDHIQYAKSAKDFHKKYFGGRKFKGNAIHYIGDKNAQPGFIIIGDSKARQFAIGLDELLKNLNHKAVMIVHDGCPFMEGVFRLKSGKALQSCADITEKSLEVIQKYNLPIISMRSWTGNQNNLLDSDGNRIDSNSEGYESWFAAKHVEFHKKIRDLISDDREIYLIGNNDGSRYAFPIINCLARPKFVEQPCIPKSGYLADEYKIPSIEVMIAEAVKDIPNTHFINMTELYCQDNYCGNLLEDNLILYSDSGHLSVYGSRKYAPVLLKLTNMYYINKG